MKTLKRAISFIKNIGKFKIRDAHGNIFDYASEPAVFFNQESGTIIAIGEYNDVNATFEHYYAMFRHQENDPDIQNMTKEFAMLRIPPLQKAVDRVMQEEGFVLELQDMLERAHMNQPRYFAS